MNGPEVSFCGLNLGVNRAKDSPRENEVGLRGRDPLSRGGDFDANGSELPRCESTSAGSNLQALECGCNSCVEGSPYRRGENGTVCLEGNFRERRLGADRPKSTGSKAARHGANASEFSASELSGPSTKIEMRVESREHRREEVGRASLEQTPAVVGEGVGVCQVSQRKAGSIVPSVQEIHHRQTEFLSWTERSQGGKLVTDTLEATDVSSRISQRSRL